MDKQFYKTLVFFALTVLFSNRVSAQAAVNPFVSIEGEVLYPLKLTIDDLSTFSVIDIKGKDKDDQEHTFKGVKLFDILDSAGVTLGKQLRGENLAKYILVKALDGYEVIFALPEIDPDFTNQIILLAYQVDGKPLPKGEGPFRLVVPNDKKHARWIREISTIKIMLTKD